MSLFPILDDEKPPPPPPPSLFPVTEDSENARSLFPSASSYPAPPPPPPSNLEWLANSSFQQSKEESSSDSESESSEDESDEGKGKEVALYSKESESEEDEDSEDEHRRRKRRRDRKREKKDKKDKKRKKKKSDKEKILELERKQQKLDPRTGSDAWKLKDPTKVYFFDPKGDQNNMVFGALYRLDVPSYYKSRNVLGLNKDLGLNFTKAGYYLYRRSAQDNSQKIRYLSKKHAVKESDVELKRVNLAAGHRESSENDEPAPNFIRLDEPKQNEQDEGETFEDYLTQRTKSFSQYTRENPHDIQAWLDFVKFQDEFLSLGKKHSRSAIVEKKLAILNKAIEENPNNEVLILLLLRESQLLWESDKVLNLWKKVISDHSKNPNMWKEYIKFLQSNFSSFSVSQLRKAYSHAINNFQSLVLSPQLRFIEMSLLDIFLQLCYFEKQAGYIEKSVAYFQAMIEFNYFCPPNLIDMRTQLRFFEGFWEAEVPRFGDEGCMGWKKWVETRQEVEVPQKRTKKAPHHHVSMETEQVSTVELPANLIQSNEQEEAEKTVFAEWVKEEESRDHIDWFPCRPLVGIGLQEGQELEDPDRVVLFEDIQGFLFRFTCEDLKIELVYRFLEFLGVNELPNRQCSNEVYRQQRIQNLEETGDLFELLVSKKASWSTDKQIKEPTLVAFIRNVFQLSSQMFPDNIDLVLAHLSFESIYSVDEARKMAKNLLKTRQTEIILWNWYAQFEKKAGKIEDARKVCSTALSLQHQLPTKSQLDSPLLFRTYAELELSLGNRDNALNALCCVFDPPFTPLKKGETVSPTRIMKSKKSYEQKMPTKNPSDKNVHTVVCFALFEYLTSGIDAACRIFEIELQRYIYFPVVHEELAMAYAQMVGSHIQKVPTPPGLLRSILTRAMSVYPTNTQFLTMFIELEARSQIANRIRSYFDDICASRPSPILWLFSIHTETARLGASHRIRTLFEKALDNPESRTCIALWRYYMDYETSKGNADLAKGIFYRSIRNVPWAKNLWLDAFRHLRPLMSTAELHDILKLMMEKEIHLRQLPQGE